MGIHKKRKNFMKKPIDKSPLSRYNFYKKLNKNDYQLRKIIKRESIYLKGGTNYERT